MICVSCGAEFKDGLNFCPQCGTPVANSYQNNYQPQQPVMDNYNQAPAGQPAMNGYPNQMNPQANGYYQQPNYNAPYNPGYPPKKPSVPGKGFGIASMVLGIVSLVFSCISIVSLACAIVGVALGGYSFFLAKQANRTNGFAVAGLACSIVTLGLAIILMISFGSAVGLLEEIF